MSNIDGIKKKAKNAIGKITEASSSLARRAKLTAAITKNRTIVRRKHIEIGIDYYKLFKDAPDEAFKESCETIKASLKNIAAMEKEIAELRRSSNR